ncbi:uncharacterized protein Dvir_GJ12660 [Drosophila virilis]|uniref:Protein arginine N-methyltransferase 6 n=1 Tax=Drosophila virilis TaxID=7244 RepID=B4LHI5_DROVI|nr:uncharacterized protein Dvir_GJ12660 [Drosophila virilis]
MSHHVKNSPARAGYDDSRRKKPKTFSLSEFHSLVQREETKAPTPVSAPSLAQAIDNGSGDATEQIPGLECVVTFAATPQIQTLSRPTTQPAVSPRGRGRLSGRVRSCPRIATPPRRVPHELQTVDRMTSADFRHDFAAHLENMRSRQKEQQHMLFFQLAIEENRHLFEGRTILVLSCGTGTLALMAARAGARHVYALDHSQMLSVQTAGCAGMERLGVPTRTSLSTPPDDRDQFRCRMRVDALQARELLAVHSSSNNQQQQQQQQQQQHHNNKQQHNNTHSINNFVARGGIEATTLKYGNTGSGSFKSDLSSTSCTSSTSSCSSLNSHSADHHQHYQYQLQQQRTPRCPHHVPLPDSEYGQDRHLQIRSSYQQSEITRSYTKPPPNKTVRDVPEQICAANASYRLAAANSCAAAAAVAAAAANSSTPAAYALAAAAGATKSKPNAITKFFSRISSPKSPTSLATGSAAAAGAASAAIVVATPTTLGTSSSLASSASMSSSASSLASSAGMPACVSPSSSASSLAAAPLTALPIANAATLKSTACSFGSTAAASAGTGSPAEQEQQDETTQ